MPGSRDLGVKMLFVWAEEEEMRCAKTTFLEKRCGLKDSY
jgi:hypothetical protein